MMDSSFAKRVSLSALRFRAVTVSLTCRVPSNSKFLDSGQNFLFSLQLRYKNLKDNAKRAEIAPYQTSLPSCILPSLVFFVKIEKTPFPYFKI